MMKYKSKCPNINVKKGSMTLTIIKHNYVWLEIAFE